MKQITINLPEETELVLNYLAQKTERSPDELVREAIESYILRESQSLPRSVGMGSSGRNDLAERSEELLWEERWSKISLKEKLKEGALHRAERDRILVEE